jgi:predicted Zn-dependent protease
VLDQAKIKGAKGDGFDKLEQRLKEAGQSSALDVAIQLKDSGKFNQAINLLKDEINQSPEHVDILALLSHCYLLADQVVEAKLHLDRARTIDPENASVGWNTARLTLKEQKTLEALNIARDTSSKISDDVEGMGVPWSLLKGKR